LKITGITQTVLPAQVPPGSTLKSALFGPVMPLLSVSVNGERLVTFKMLTVLLADCATLPNARLAGRTVAGIVGPVLSAIVWGPSGSGLSETVRVPDSVPSTPGANDTVIVQVLEAASVELQVPPVTEKSAALVPLKFSPRVTGCV
jgi:hypothetical protein